MQILANILEYVYNISGMEIGEYKFIGRRIQMIKKKKPTTWLFSVKSQPKSVSKGLH